MSKKNKILSYILIFFPLLIFTIEVSSLFITRGNNFNRRQTKYDAITGWRKECKNNYSNVQNKEFLICNRHGLIKTPYQSKGKNIFGILLLGNSVAMGEGLYGYENNKTFASQLELNLRNQDTSIDLVNAAYSGFNSWQEYSEMIRYLNAEPFFDDLPALDMVVSFGGIQDFWRFVRLLNTFNNPKKMEYSFANNMMIEKTTIEYINFLSSSTSGNIKSGFSSFINAIKAKSRMINIFDNIYNKIFSNTIYNKKTELVINDDNNSASGNLKDIVEKSFGLNYKKYEIIRDYSIKSTIRNLKASSNVLNPEINYVYVYAPTYFSSLSENSLNNKYVIGIRHLVGFPKFSLKIFESEMRIIESDYRSALIREIKKIPAIILLDYSGEAKSNWFFDYSHFTEFAASKISFKLSNQLLQIKNKNKFISK